MTVTPCADSIDVPYYMIACTDANNTSMYPSLRYALNSYGFTYTEACNEATWDGRFMRRDWEPDEIVSGVHVFNMDEVNLLNNRNSNVTNYTIVIAYVSPCDYTDWDAWDTAYDERDPLPGHRTSEFFMTPFTYVEGFKITLRQDREDTIQICPNQVSATSTYYYALYTDNEQMAESSTAGHNLSTTEMWSLLANRNVHSAADLYTDSLFVDKTTLSPGHYTFVVAGASYDESATPACQATTKYIVRDFTIKSNAVDTFSLSWDFTNGSVTILPSNKGDDDLYIFAFVSNAQKTALNLTSAAKVLNYYGSQNVYGFSSEDDVFAGNMTVSFSDWSTNYGLNLIDLSQAGDYTFIVAYCSYSGGTCTVTSDYVMQDFTIAASVVTGVEETDEAVATQKIFRDGQILILRNGRTYDSLGRMLE